MTWAERIRDELSAADPPRTIRVAVDDAYAIGGEPYAVETAHEEGAPKEDARLVVLRLRDLVVIDAGTHAALAEKTRTELAPHAVLFEDLHGCSLNKIGPFTVSTVLQLSERDLTGFALIDAGAGEGEISLIAAHRGARPILLVEYDPALLEKARRNFEGNGYREGEDYRLVEADLTDSAGVAAAIADAPGPALLVSNIGHWPLSYSVSNASSIALLPLVPQISEFVAGGYATWTSHGGLEHAEQDQSVLEPLGFHVRRPPSSWARGAFPTGLSTMVDDERRAYTAERDESIPPRREEFEAALAARLALHLERRQNPA